jgi:hypothetical protein
VSPTPEIEQLGSTVVSDADHGQHFGHHQQFRDRYAGVSWTYDKIRVSASTLVCQYSKLGDGQCPGGLAGLLGVGSLFGVRLVSIAAGIRERVEADAVLAKHPLIQKIGGLMVLGAAGIYGLPQQMMLNPGSSAVDVIEGNHRYLALILLGEDRVTGVDWSRIRPV